MTSDINIENLDTEMKNEYYVYEYYIQNTNDVFYVGKGTKNRAWKDVRNAACEQIKNEYDWDIRIVKDNLTEESALELEKELIVKYREKGDILTNILPGGIKPTDSNIIGNIKYLLFLLDKKVINISLNELANLFFISSSTVWHIANAGHYSEIEESIPENIDDIVNTYHYNAYNEEKTRAGNIKYVLSLMERGVIKASQAKIAEYFNMTGSNVSSIKKQQTHPDVPPIIPNDIGKLLKEFDPFFLSEEEKLKGYISFILRLRNEGILSITNTEIGNILDTTLYMISEFTRTSEERRYQFKEVRPTEEIMKKLLPYFIIK